MSIALPRVDLEEGAAILAELGFDAVEVHVTQIGPGVVPVVLSERHAEAAAESVRAAGLSVAALNAAGGAGFEPFADPASSDSSSEELGRLLRMTAAMGAPRVLVWDGRAESSLDAAAATRLAQCISRGYDLSGLQDPPEVSVELHPFTFGLANGLAAELADALRSAGAGICFDFCHFGVALGPDLVDQLTDGLLNGVNHVHWSDTDCMTSELHFPPGAGVLELKALGRRLAGRNVAIAWDLFGWPGPRAAMRRCMAVYESFIREHFATLERERLSD